MFTGFLRAAFDVVGYLFGKVESEGKSVTLDGCRSARTGEVLKRYGLGA